MNHSDDTDNRQPPPRWPLDPLVGHLRLELHRNGGQLPGEHLGLAELADRLGINYRRAQRWLVDGIPDRYADTAACTLGRHPAELWPGWSNACTLDDDTDPTSDDWYSDDPPLDQLDDDQPPGRGGTLSASRVRHRLLELVAAVFAGVGLEVAL